MLIKAKFVVKNGKLEIKTDFSGFPKQEEIIYISGSTQKQIKSIQDLKNLVVIESKDSAIDFVRLITSPLTFDILAVSNRMLEVVDSKSMDSSMTFGEKNLAKFASQKNDGYLGVTPQKILNKIRFQNIDSDIYQNKFKIRRFIIKELDMFEVKCYIISELVSREGAYSCKIEQVIKYVYNGWRFPSAQ